MHVQRLGFGSWRARATAALALVAAIGAGVTWQGSAAALEPAPAAAVEAAASAAPAAIDARDSYADVVETVAPAVVTIRVRARAAAAPAQFRNDDMLRRFFGEDFDLPRRAPQVPRQGLGSGVVVSEDGYILTNHHVIDGAQDILVEFTDGRALDASLVGSDPASDLALLQVNATNLRALTLGDSDAVRVGDVVLAVGNPLGVGQTVTLGIISAKGRSTGPGDGSYEDFLQTDAPINRGNSGGALVSTRGELVGINSQILSPSGGSIGIGFAIPANMARHVMHELRTEGRVRRGLLGVTVQPVTSDLAESLALAQVAGAMVSAVEQGSAAHRAGVRQGDVITSFNGQPVSDSNALRNRVATATPGTTAALVVIRDGRERTLSVTLDEASSSAAAPGRGSESAESGTLGMAVTPLTPELAARAGVSRGTEGLLVQDVRPDSRAARAGIRPGDVIQEVNRQPVPSVSSLREALEAVSDRPALLLVLRDGRTLYVTVRR